MTSREKVTDAYDTLADEYEEVAERAPHNAYREFPTMTALIPDVEGDRVLDAGCGAGRYAEWLCDKGADVVACDASEEMVKQARKRLNDVPVHQADIAESLAFADDDEFNGVVCSGVLDYLNDWHASLETFTRVLRPGGFLVASVGHPFSEVNREAASNYFEIELREPEFDVGAPLYRRPLEEIVRPLLDAGLRLDGLREPQPTEAFREAAPEEYEEVAQEPVFLCVRAVCGQTRDPC